MVLNEIRANIVLPPSDEGGGLPLGKTEGEIALNPNLSYKLTKKVNAVVLIILHLLLTLHLVYDKMRKNVMMRSTYEFKYMQQLWRKL
jgi:hypothetical protein